MYFMQQSGSLREAVGTTSFAVVEFNLSEFGREDSTSWKIM